MHRLSKGAMSKSKTHCREELAQEKARETAAVVYRRCNAIFTSSFPGQTDKIRTLIPVMNLSSKRSVPSVVSHGRQQTPAATHQVSKRVALFQFFRLKNNGSASALLTMSTGCRASTPESFRPAAFVQTPEELGPARSGRDTRTARKQIIIRLSPTAVCSKTNMAPNGSNRDRFPSTVWAVLRKASGLSFTIVERVNIQSAPKKSSEKP